MTARISNHMSTYYRFFIVQIKTKVENIFPVQQNVQAFITAQNRLGEDIWTASGEWTGVNTIQQNSSPWNIANKKYFKVLFDTGIKFLDGRPSTNIIPPDAEGNNPGYTTIQYQNSIYPHIEHIPFNCYNVDPIEWSRADDEGLDPLTVQDIQSGLILYCMCSSDLADVDQPLFFSITENLEWLD